jgi:hypothetical protein
LRQFCFDRYSARVDNDMPAMTEACLLWQFIGARRGATLC